MDDIIDEINRVTQGLDDLEQDCLQDKLFTNESLNSKLLDGSDEQSLLSKQSSDSSHFLTTSIPNESDFINVSQGMKRRRTTKDVNQADAIIGLFDCMPLKEEKFVRTVRSVNHHDDFEKMVPQLNPRDSVYMG